jgi:uncharacterized protein DUF1259
MLRILALCATLLLVSVPTADPPDSAVPQKLPSWAASVRAILSREGTMQPGDVFRIAVARSDLRVIREGVVLEPRFAYSAWAAVMPMGKTGEVMMMGDLVLTSAEVDPVLRRLLKGGMQVTALHNHLKGENPRLMYLHYGGEGPPSALAVTLKEALALTSSPRYEPPQELVQDMETTPPELTAAYDQVQRILGHEGKTVRRVLQISIPRVEPIRCDNLDLPPAMGVATQLNFQPAGSGLAATGDFVLTDDELQGLLQTLALGSISVEAIHSHMTHEKPALKFVHFYTQGPAETVATGLRAALDQTAVKR